MKRHETVVRTEKEWCVVRPERLIEELGGGR